MRLILIRHGETESNVRMALDTRPPGSPLNERGRQQAQRLAVELGAEPIAAVYASTAVRTQQTAEPLATKLGLSVQVVDGVQEVAAGDFEDRTDRDSLLRYQAMCASWARGELDVALPGAQTGHEFRDRYTTTLNGLRERHPEQTIALVSHGAAIRLATGLLSDNMDPAEIALELLPNTAQVILDSTPIGWHCTAWPA